MSWVITDRITRVNFYAALVLAGLALVPVLNDQGSILLMAAILMLVYQAWRLAMGRQVRVRIDSSGITKIIGGRTWRLDWAHARGARLVSFLGSPQLVLTSATETGWNSSDKLYYRLGRSEVAVQVPEAMLPELRELLEENGFPIS